MVKFGIGAIHVIESLSANDLKTGTALSTVLPPLVQGAVDIEICFHTCGSAAEMNATLSRIESHVRKTGRPPVLHFETHGAVDETKTKAIGLSLANGDVVEWVRLKPALAAINVASRMNLLVIAQACIGLDLSFVFDDVCRRAAAWGVMGPTRLLSPPEIHAANRVFYEELVQSLDGGVALRRTQQRVPHTYAVTLAEELFLGAFEREIRRRPQTIPILRDIFHGARREFFFIDLCPDHEARFPVGFETLVGRAIQGEP